MLKQFMGMVGLGVMGQNLVLNIERNGFSVAGFDLDENRVDTFREKAKGKQITVHRTLSDFIDHLEVPKRIMMMVPAGASVDTVIQDVMPYLVPGDLLIDGGNTHFKDTERRMKNLKENGVLYIGTGISGGEEGALRGPSIMPGGNPDAWPLVKPIFQAISAKVDDGTPCCDWVGEGGAGHFVKMVHNGIEYGDMQMICEAYFLMERMLGLNANEMSRIFSKWNQGELNSYLIEITSDIMDKNDTETGKPLIDVILDTAGQKGTGKWTSQVALDLGIPAATIAEAVFARTLSAIKEERVNASKSLSGPKPSSADNKDVFVEKIRKALYISKICSYAQGFQLMRAASEEYEWNLQFGRIALMWRGGCIIRAQFLNNIKEAFDHQPDLPNLLLNPYFQSIVESHQKAWRDVVIQAITSGIPVPAFSSALAYYDGYRSERLPANLLQAQRDYFGAHTYERIDKPRGSFFHTQWTRA
jgi:6-phosphogluconate dehydrogenase